MSVPILMSAAPVTDPPTLLLERDGELDRIDALLRAAGAEAGGVLAIRGPMGAGKTRLLEVAQQRAEAAGLRVLRARAGELEQVFSFGVVRQLFEPLARRLLDEPAGSALSGPARMAVRMILDDETASPGLVDPAFPVLHGLHWLCVDLVQSRPLLMTIDDAHWADAPSLRWLDFLCRRLEGEGVGVIVAFRDPAPPQRELLAGVLVQTGVDLIDLRGLSEAAVTALLEHQLGAPAGADLAHACAEATAGNPLLVTSLVESLRDTRVEGELRAGEALQAAGQSVAARVRRRIHAMGADGGALAAAVAVLGPAATLQSAGELASLPRRSAEDAADALTRAGILSAGPVLRFVHPLMRTAVYEELDPGHRSRWHDCAAHLLAEAGRPAEDVAMHLVRVAPARDAWAVARLRGAARMAAAKGAPESAVTYLRRAALERGVPDRAAVLAELAHAEARAGGAEAADRYRDARAITEDPRAAARLVIAEAGVRAVRGESGAALDLLDGALEQLAPAAAEVATEVESALISLGQVDLAIRPRLAQRIAALAGTQPHSDTVAGRARSAALAGEAMVAGDAERAARLARHGLWDGHLVDALGVESPMVILAINALSFIDRYAEAEEYWAKVLRTARECGSALGYGTASAFRGTTRLRSGDLRAAESDLRAGFDTLRDLGILVPASVALGGLLPVLAESGRCEEAKAQLAAFAPAELAPAFHVALHGRGELRFAEGRWSEALADFELYGARSAEWEMDCSSLFGWRGDAALCLLRMGDNERARALAAEELDRARRASTPRALGRALRAVALTGDPEHRASMLEAAVAVLDGAGARLDQAYAVVDHGADLRARGRRSDAREALLAGLDLADRCGSTRLAARAVEELHTVGARPRRARRSGADALTATERRVAGMAAAGMSNVEIAQDLFVTRKAVEKHVSAVLAKLGIGSRKLISEALGES